MGGYFVIAKNILVGLNWIGLIVLNILIFADMIAKIKKIYSTLLALKIRTILTFILMLLFSLQFVVAMSIPNGGAFIYLILLLMYLSNYIKNYRELQNKKAEDHKKRYENRSN